jgi:hypothetical protein
MQRPLNMSENGLHRDAPACGDTNRHRNVCEKLLPGLVLISLARAGEALAGDQVVIPGEAFKPDFNLMRQAAPLSVPMFTAPATYQTADLPERQTFSAHDFRPRGHSVFDDEPQSGTSPDAPLLRSTTVWQRLADYRTRGGVRLLTLWETGGSSVSLQAGRKGEPSLQWTSRLMNRGGATRGVLDQLFATSIAGAGRSMHFTPRSSNSEPAKQARLPDSGASK